MLNAELKTSRKHIQILASVAANLGQATRAFCISMSSYMIPQLLKGEGGLQLSEEESSWFASIFAIGCITGALHGGYFSDKLGRKTCMILDCLGYILGFLLIAFATDFNLLIIGRLVTGHFSGSSVVSAPIFVGETSHHSLRGLTGNLLVILYCTGFTASMIIGALLSWRSVLLVATCIPAVSLLMLLFMKESPSWLLRQNRKEDCYDSLMFYRGNELIVQSEMQRISQTISKQNKENELLGDSVLQRFQNKLRRVVSPGFLKPFSLLVCMTSLGWEWGGFPALSYYLHTIIEEVHIPLDSNIVAIGLSAYRTLVIIVLTPLINKAPRRKMYLISGILVALALFTQSSYSLATPFINTEIQEYTKWTPLLAILLQYTGYSMGWGVLVYNFLGEILPSDMRSTGSALIGIIQNIALFSSVKMIPVIISSYGAGVLFGVYFISILIVLIVCTLFMPETKGMSLEDIEDMYDNNTKKDTPQEKV